MKSPNSYGYNYATGLDCKYDISVRSGNGVKLSWRTFDVKGHMPSCNNDYVEIYIGCRSDQRSIGRFCSENSQKPFTVYSPYECLQLVFKTDSSVGGKGFQADYERISLASSSFLDSSACSGTKTMKSSSGVIHSYQWPRSDTRSRNCYWKIDLGSNKGIKIAFMDVHLENGAGCDIVNLVKVKGGSIGQSYNSSSTIQASLCRSQKAFSLTSTKGRIWIRFKSKGYRPERGFVVGYVIYDTTKRSSGSSGATVVGIILAIVVFTVAAV